jgi:predicted DNA-binding protein YlxM (UPF0122 family)
MKDLKVSLLLDFYGGILTDKQLDALELYYNEDLSLAEIAQHTKITRQGVRDSIKRGEAILFEMEEKLGFYKKYHNIGEKVSEVLNLTENIRDINSRHCRSVEISEFCDDIQAVLSPLTEQKQ